MFKREELAARLTEIQNYENWKLAKKELIFLLNNTLTLEDFMLLMEEIQNRDWIW